MAETPTRPEMTEERLTELRLQVPRGLDFYEAVRARTMRDFRPKNPDAGDIVNTLRYALLDAAAGQLPCDAAYIRLAVQAQLDVLLAGDLHWLLEAAAGVESVPPLPPMLTFAETEARRVAARNNKA